MVWYGMVWYGMVWFSLVYIKFEQIFYSFKIIVLLDKVKDIKLLQEDLSTGVRHHLLKSSSLDTITNVLGINGLLVY
jgi:hypothetical protein